MTGMKAPTATFIIAATIACASARPSVSADPPGDNAGILSLLGRYVDGHACAVSPTRALSCAHMADMRPFDKEVGLMPSRYSDGAGNEGVVLPLLVSSVCDLALYSGEFEHYYPIAEHGPSVGEHLRFLGYDWRDKRRAYAPRVLDAKVLRDLSGHLVLDVDPPAEVGSSGSCVLNDKDEVVAINCFSRSVGLNEQVSLVVSIYGAWKPDLREEP